MQSKFYSTISESQQILSNPGFVQRNYLFTTTTIATTISAGLGHPLPLPSYPFILGYAYL